MRKEIPEIHFPKDKHWIKFRTIPNYTVTIGKRENIMKKIIRPRPHEEEIINCFTDGSKTEIGCGTAYAIYSQSIEKKEYIHLGELTTVFQAEITAITRAGLTLLEENIVDKTINIYVDSQGALKALSKMINTQRTVGECKRILNKLNENNRVNLNWIPAHSFQLGNEIADRLAKRGANNIDDGLEPRLPISEETINTSIKKWSKDRHNCKWRERTNCRQTKLVLPEIGHKWSRRILNYDRRHLRIIIQLVTGHANLKRHRYLMGLEDNANCDICEEQETAIHMITTCARYTVERMAILDKPIIQVQDISKYPLRKILNFACETNRWN